MASISINTIQMIPRSAAPRIRIRIRSTATLSPLGCAPAAASSHRNCASSCSSAVSMTTSSQQQHIHHHQQRLRSLPSSSPILTPNKLLCARYKSSFSSSSTSNYQSSMLHKKAAAALKFKSNAAVNVNTQMKKKDELVQDDTPARMTAIIDNKEETHSINNTTDDSSSATINDAQPQSQPYKPSQHQHQHHYHLHEFAPRIVVIGIGGAGGNALNNMISRNLTGVDFLALNTDAQHLSTTLTDRRIQIGAGITSGLGCGANPDAGRAAAEESRDVIAEAIDVHNTHMVFLTAGMGGGTGTGAAPVVAELCYNAGILTVAVVTKPFVFEGRHRMRLAHEGLQNLKSVVDSMLVIPNQNLFHLVNESTTFIESFKLADDVLLAGVRGITDLMTSPGLINLDFADVQSVMHGMGNAMLGTGQAEGEGRAIKAAEAALQNPLLGEIDISTAKGMLVNITGGADMTLFEVDKAAQRITQVVKDENANIIFGSAFDASLDGSIKVSIVATGIEDGDKIAQQVGSNENK